MVVSLTASTHEMNSGHTSLVRNRTRPYPSTSDWAMNGSPEMMASTARTLRAAGMSGGGISSSFTSLIGMPRWPNARNRISRWLLNRFGTATVLPRRSSTRRMGESLWTIMAVPSRWPR